jgi:hypothetical protein
MVVITVTVRLVAVSGAAMTSDAAQRRARALTLPSVLFASALAGHVVADGVTPATSVLVPLLVLIVFAVAPFVGARTSPALTVALLAGGQGLLHAALQVLGGTASATTTVSGTAPGVAAASAPTSSHLTHHGAATSPGSVMSRMSDGHMDMLLAHLAAGVVVGLWLAAGERACWKLLALTARPVVDAWLTVTAAASGGAVVVSRPGLQPGWGLRSAIPRSVWTAGVVSRRGPPRHCVS